MLAKPEFRHLTPSADLDIDSAVHDLGRVGADVGEHGSAERLAAGVVKAPVVLGALDAVAHDQAVAEQRLFVGAVAIGGVIGVVRGAVDRVGVAAVVEGNDVLAVDVAGLAGSDPLAHQVPPWYRPAVRPRAWWPAAARGHRSGAWAR